MRPVNIKNILTLFLLCFAILLSPVNASAEILIGKAYYQSLHKYLTQSADSITVAMYFIIINPADSTDPVNELVDGLITAKKRGVKVKVILEDSKLKENRLAYEKLQANNIPVYFDTSQHLLHIKGVVIDGRYVFIGSANWSKAAIEDNYEVTYFQDSPEDALVFKQHIDSIPVQKKDMFLPQSKGVALSADFLLNPDTGRVLLKAEAYKQLDLYLLLCKLQQETVKSSFKVDYEALAKKLGYLAPMNLGKYRDNYHYYYERIHRSLKRLKDYGLINYRKSKVSLKAVNKSKGSTRLIRIPFEYWEYGYPNRLSMRAKYMYLICLYEAGQSTRYPFWF
ncbi:MAG: phospholipase D-like domain-containing protein, partial [Candidatus Omnitrophica bacterium]|nr:phospholipase D-like domain-containing protein [Candidatus Omnitrophota bacterium]